MRGIAAGLVIIAVVMGAVPAGASGQVAVAAHASFVPGINTGASEEGLGSTIGVGGRGEIVASRLGVRILGSLEMFFPDCGAEDCEYEIGTVSVIYDLETESGVFPYLGAGLSVQNADGRSSAIGNRSDWGGHLVAGFRMGQPGLRPFVDVRYQLMPDFENQFALSAGVSFMLWTPQGF